MIERVLTVAAIATLSMTATVQAATLSGLFDVTAVNVTNLDSTESQATVANFDAALLDTLGGDNSVSVVDSFTYDGDLDFRVGSPQTADFSISQFLDTGTGTVDGLESSFGDMQLSFPNIGDGTATTTFFFFTLTQDLGAGTFDITHDDGVVAFDDGELLGGNVGPTGERNTIIGGFDGGTASFLYVATNGNPSIFEVDTDAELSPVPLPAAGWMLLAGVGGLAAASKRRKRNAS